MKRNQPKAAKSQSPSSLNARKHGLTARLDNSACNGLATLKMVDALTKGNRDPEILHAAEKLAGLQMTLVSVRREKASLINRGIGSVRTSTSELKGRGKTVGESGSNRGVMGFADSDHSSESAMLASSEAKAVANNLEQLATLDNYERRALSRRRKAAFALLLALEQSAEQE